MTSLGNLKDRIRQVRRRWRMQNLIKGISLFLASTIGLLVLGVWGAELFGFSTPAVWVFRLLTGGMACFVAFRFLYRPLSRRITDVQVAQYVEETFPQLEDRLVTAVEFGSAGQISPGMLDMLIRDALEKTSRLDFSLLLDRKRLASYGAAALTALLVLAVLLNWGPSFFPYGFDRLYVRWAEASIGTPRMIQVSPGNAEVAHGSDQQVKAQLVGFDSPEVQLFYQREGSTGWDALRMDPEQKGTGFVYLLLDVTSSLRYYVEAQGVKSEIYTMATHQLARVEQVDLTYHFPAYTGMSPQTVEDDGDISALKGTKVEINVHLNQNVASGTLVFDDGTTLDLKRAADKEYTATLDLRRSGSYVVQVPDSQGRSRAASPEYQVEAIDDAPPKVSITRPMRDLRATSVEEVFSEFKAEDDIGVGKVELHYSVNGGPEKVVDLFDGRPRSESTVTAAHTFFLEEFGLQPGDLVSYYGQAKDANTLTGPGTSSSDIYFIQIRPFEQNYIQNQSAPGPGGAGSGGEEALSKQQKEIISATFKLIRDKDTIDPKEYADDLKSLALIQNRLQSQAQGLVDRLFRRGGGDSTGDFAKLAEYLKAAIVEMEKASVHLADLKPVEALPEEQKALQQLMRAESFFKEIQVSFMNQGGGGGGQANAEDLADLFELELNKLKNQYETVQRGEQQARDQKTDELLQRLKELAQRQQQLNERNRMMSQAGSSSGSASSGSGQSQQQLAQEAEQLKRQLQRLSREKSSPELNRVSSQLQQAIDQMKKAAERSQGGNSREAASQGIRALQQLEDATRSLTRSQDSGLSRGVEEAAEESQRMLEEQKRIQESIENLAQGKGGGSEAQQKSEVEERKNLLAERMAGLGERVEDLARQARGSQKVTSSKLNEAAGTIRDKRLPERIRQGNAFLQAQNYEFMKAREDYIRSNMEELARQLDSAKNSLGQTPESKLADAANRARQLAEGLESMQQRMQNLQRGQGREGSQAKQGEPSTAGKGQQGGQEGPATSASDRQGAQKGRPGEQSGSAQGTPQQGQGQENPAGGRPGRDVQGLTANAFGPPIGIGPYGDERQRQLQRELSQRILDARDLGRLMNRNSTEMRNLEQVIEALQNVNKSREYDDPEEAARLKAAIDLMRQIELDLSRELARMTQKDKYFYSDDNEAPNMYRKLVEEYYKALAKGRP